jgi:DNA-binding beta-propeller fold protein YncE
MVARNRISSFVLALLLCCSCTHEPQVAKVAEGGYPAEIAAIMITKCATDGCHNNLSYKAAGGLNLTTWDELFKGAGTGSVLVPHRPDFSPLCYFTNVDSSLGPALEPTMPLYQQPLSKMEYFTLVNWIMRGAPDANGKIKFADNPARKKYYVANRLCDVVTVIDAASMLQMRYIDVGNKPATEFPYAVKVAPDSKRWYVTFFAQSNMVQQFSADDDRLVGELNLGTGIWTSLAITQDSRYGYFIDNSSPGKIAYADLEERKVLTTYTFNDKFKYPVGIVINSALKKIYVGSLSGNFIYKLDITDPMHPVIKELPIDGTNTVQYQSLLDPIEMMADEESGLCYIACAASKEIRVVDMKKDSLVTVITLDSSPAYMAVSKAAKKLFVSCPDDVTSFTGNRGSVAVIDLQSNVILKKIKTGYQPYGIAINDELKIAAVVNASISSAGPASHHVSGCGKKNGNVTFIDLNTLNLISGKKLEVAVYPYGIASR